MQLYMETVTKEANKFKLSYKNGDLVQYNWSS